MSKALKGALVLLWLGAVAIAIGQELRRVHERPGESLAGALAGAEADAEGGPLVPASVRDLWFGAYLKATKVGYTHSRMRRVPGGVAFEDESHLDLQMLGQSREIEMHQHGRLDEHFSLERTVFVLSSEGSRFEAEARRVGGKLEIVLRTGGGEQRLSQDVEGPLYSPAALYPYLRARGIRVGEEYALAVYDPAVQQKTILRARVAAKETVEVGGTPRELYRIEQTMLEVTTVAWIDEDAALWMERSPEGFTLVRESAQRAKEGITGGDLDLALLFSVPLREPIAHAEKLAAITYRLGGLPGNFGSLSDFRQQLLGQTLRVRREEVPERGAYTLPLREGKERAFLEPEPLIPADDPKLLRRARDILKGETDPVRAARLLTRWVYEALDKTPVVGVPNALEALETRQGDCNEHATLLVGLARAAGLPARLSVGLVHQAGRLYYHAWSELFVGRWITADAALGQLPADVTHIRLAEGSLGSQAKIANVLGKLRVRVEGAEPAPAPAAASLLEAAP